MLSKLCRKCNSDLPISEFHKAKREKDGLQSWCKTCRKGWKHEERKAYHKKRYYEGHDKYLNWSYNRKYGISLKQYNKMLADQNGGCKICGKQCITGKRLAVDHDHVSGEVRGLLCGNCNKGIGCFQDNIELLLKTIEYLKKERVV